MSNVLVMPEASTSVGQGSVWADWAGMSASIACALHCAAMPLVLAYLPALGLSWLADEGFHRWMAAICFVLAVAAFVPGWRRHRSLAPAKWGAAGILLLTTATFGLEGACCASHSTDSANVVAIEESCSDVACSSCQPPPTVNSESDNSLARLALLVTPLGGILLVIGHFVNHRKSCICHGSHCRFTSDETEHGKMVS